MSYVPTSWKKGDKITSEKLNKLEQGVSAPGIMLVQFTQQSEYTMRADKTFNEVKAAILSGQRVFMKLDVRPDSDDEYVYVEIVSIMQYENNQGNMEYIAMGVGANTYSNPPIVPVKAGAEDPDELMYAMAI